MMQRKSFAAQSICAVENDFGKNQIFITTGLDGYAPE